MKTKSVLIILGLVFTPGTTCLGNNNLFLPGDAFFPAILTKSDVGSLQTARTGKRTFAYSSFGGYEGAFCGYAGYANATIPHVDDAFAKHLEDVYAKIREFEDRELVERIQDGKTELVETNGIRVLFYSPDFQFPKYHLGLRYNENWVAEAAKFGHKREHLRLCCLVSAPEAVACSWRDADEVPALNAELPKVDLRPVPMTKEPIVVREPVKAVVIGTQTLLDLFEPNDDDYLTVYIVDSNGITELVRDEGRWQERESN